jgi:hypothetical protein
MAGTVLRSIAPKSNRPKNLPVHGLNMGFEAQWNGKPG